MRRSWMADHAARHFVRIEKTVLHENGERETIALDQYAEISALESGLVRKLDCRKAWKRNALCVICGHLVDAPTDAGVVEIDGGTRVACKVTCLLKAIKAAVAQILDRNPTLNARIAARREARS